MSSTTAEIFASRSWRIYMVYAPGRWVSLSSPGNVAGRLHQPLAHDHPLPLCG